MTEWAVEGVDQLLARELPEDVDQLKELSEQYRDLLEAYAQMSFERERRLAWLSAQVAATREGALSPAAALLCLARNKRWLVSLPFRVLGHPLAYLRMVRSIRG